MENHETKLNVAKRIGVSGLESGVVQVIGAGFCFVVGAACKGLTSAIKNKRDKKAETTEEEPEVTTEESTEETKEEKKEEKEKK